MSGAGAQQGLIERLLTFTFVLADGKKFVESGQNTVKLSGLRAKTKIVKAGGPSMGTSQTQIYGMTLSVMNQLSTLGMLVSLVPRNSITIEAGDAVNGMAVCFQGTITAAWTDFEGMPEVCFQVEAHTGLAEAVTPAIPTSFKGSVDVATILSGLAAQMGVPFENNGVQASLSNPYFYGSPRNQALAVVRAAGCSWNGMEDGTLAIWPKNGARGGSIPLISKATGLVKIPQYTAQGIKFSTLYNPSIGFGKKLEVQCRLKPASGIWAVFGLDHDLSTLVPNGDWFSRVQAYNPNFDPPVAQ